jgi:hypothetical protein
MWLFSSPWTLRSGFHPRLHDVGFVVDKVTLEPFPFLVLRFSPISIITPVFYTDNLFIHWLCVALFTHTVRDSAWNHGVNEQQFWNTGKNFKYRSKCRRNFCPVTGNTGVVAVLWYLKRLGNKTKTGKCCNSLLRKIYVCSLEINNLHSNLAVSELRFSLLIFLASEHFYTWGSSGCEKLF